jgi:hypothetical protein
MMTGVLRRVPQRTVIGTVIKVFRFFPSRTRRHAGAKDRDCLRVLCSFVCIARCMANDDGNGIAQQQNAFKQLSTGQWGCLYYLLLLFLLFLTGPLLVFLVVIFLIPSVHFLTRCFCTVKSRRLVCNLPPFDIDRYERNVLASCYNVLPTHLRVGSISNSSRCLTSTSTTTISVSSQVKLEQLSPPPTMEEVSKAVPFSPKGTASTPRLNPKTAVPSLLHLH